MELRKIKDVAIMEYLPRLGTESRNILTPLIKALTSGSIDPTALFGASVPQKSPPSAIRPTLFGQLSKEAQDLIVRSTLGEFDSSPPPKISAQTKAEIAQWAQSSES